MPRTAAPELDFRDRPGTRSTDDSGPVIGLVPADRVSVVAVDLPEVRGARLAQALRWAAEDALAGDAEQQHVVPLGRRSDGRMVCAVASREDMARWRAHDPHLIALVPDAAALPWQAGELVLAADGDAVLARWGARDFDRLDGALLDMLLPELAEQAGAERVVWYGGAPPDAIEALNPQRREAPSDLRELLAAGAADTSVNLLYGDFAPAAQRPAPARRWTLVLALLAAVLWIADTGVESLQLQRQAAALDEEIRERAARLFPDLPLMAGRERLQIERALADRREGGDGFVRVLRRAGPVFGGLDAVTVESMRWNDTGLELDLRVPGLPDLEAMERQLANRGLATRVEDVTIDAGNVRGRIVLEESR